MNDKDFVDVRLSKRNLDRFFIRRSIIIAIEDNLQKFKGKLLDVGCGKMPYKNYINANSSIASYEGLDIDNALEYDKNSKPDFHWDGVKMPFLDNSYDTIFATEVFEHCPDLSVILSEINRVIAPNGILFFTVPFLWPLHEVPNDAYRFTPFTLKRELENNGFTDIEIKATGGWHASLAQMLGLWVKRGISNKRTKSLLSLLLLPVIRFLIKKDKVNDSFVEGSMSPGYFGLAYKQ